MTLRSELGQFIKLRINLIGLNCLIPSGSLHAQEDPGGASSRKAAGAEGSPGLAADM